MGALEDFQLGLNSGIKEPPVSEAEGETPFKFNIEEQEKTDFDKIVFASQVGFGDTYRGIKQMFGVDEEEMAEEQRRLKKYLADPEIGGSVMAAYTAGLVGDPFGWVIPGMKAKNLYSATKAGVAMGAAVGATGYVDEDTTRIKNTMWGIAGGGILSPAMFKAQHTLGPAINKAYSKVLKDPLIKAVKKVTTPIGESDKGQRLGRFWIDNYGLPEAYVKAKGEKRINHSKWAAKFEDLIKKHGSLNAEEDALLYRVLTGEESKLPHNLTTLSKQSRKLVDDMGQEMVDLGLLDKGIFLKNKGKYIHRTYEKTEAPKIFGILRNPKQAQFFGEELMRRGHTINVPKSQINKKLQEGYEVVAGTRPLDKTVQMNRDWTAAERKDMGEVVSSAYALAKSGKLMTNDMATFKFYDDLAKNKDLVWTAHSKAEIPPAGYVRVPIDKAKGGVNTYGNLAGKYVPENVMKDLKEIKRGEWWRNSVPGKIHHNMQSWWKRTKTSLNPVVHMNNVMSNFVLYDLVDANYKYVASAAKDMFQQKGDFLIAKELGIFNADLFKNELNKLNKDIFAQYMKKNTGNTLQDAWNKTKGIGTKTKDYLSETHLDKLYQAEDNVFRLGLFKDRIAKGDTPEEAAAFARKYMLDYEIHAPGVKLLRGSFLPFISYTYRVAPILLETAIHRPWKIAKWGSLLYGANLIGIDIAEGDIERERRYQKELDQGFDMFDKIGLPGAHTMVKIPRTDKSQYLDVSRWIPGGDVLDFSSQGLEFKGLPAPLQPSGGWLGGLGKIATGFDTFRQDFEPGVGSGVAEFELEARKNIFMKEFMPMYHQYSKLQKGLSGKSHPSKDDYTIGEALLNTIGVKVKEFDMKKVKPRVAYKYKNKIGSLQSKIRDSYRNFKGGLLTSKEYKRQLNKVKEELVKIEKEAKEAMR